MKKRVSDYLSMVSNVVGGTCILMMAVLIAVEVFMRNIVGTSTLVSDEYSGYLMVFITYWGAATAFHSGSFVRVEAIFDRFPQKVQAVLNRVYEFLFFVFNSYLTYYFFKAFYKVWIFKSAASTVARTPLWIPYGICWLGLMVFELYLLAAFVESIIYKDKGGETK